MLRLFKPVIMCPAIHHFKTHYHWFERAKHILEIMNTETHYRWFEIMNTGTHYRWFEIMNTGIHYRWFALSNQR
jgi:hypothetical protein